MAKSSSDKNTPKNAAVKAAAKESAKASMAKAAAQVKPDFYNPAYYTNRELSWLDFNYRILDEARDKTNPLFERLKFLSITA